MEEMALKEFKKWMAVFLSVFGGLAAAAVLLVVYVDPFFQYHKPLEHFPYVVDHQVNQNPGMAKHMEYDSVILGSSMTVNFNTGWFQELFVPLVVAAIIDVGIASMDRGYIIQRGFILVGLALVGLLCLCVCEDLCFYLFVCVCCGFSKIIF